MRRLVAATAAGGLTTRWMLGRMTWLVQRASRSPAWTRKAPAGISTGTHSRECGSITSRPPGAWSAHSRVSPPRSVCCRIRSCPGSGGVSWAM